MNVVISILILAIAILHIFFFILEMFLWTKPLGLKVFRQSPQQAEASKVLAANQGLYNGFLVAGLFWSLVETNSGHAFSLKIFFLSCVFIAGLFGAITVSRRIFWIQACPALVALILIFFI